MAQLVETGLDPFRELVCLSRWRQVFNGGQVWRWSLRGSFLSRTQQGNYRPLFEGGGAQRIKPANPCNFRNKSLHRINPSAGKRFISDGTAQTEPIYYVLTQRGPTNKINHIYVNRAKSSTGSSVRSFVRRQESSPCFLSLIHKTQSRWRTLSYCFIQFSDHSTKGGCVGCLPKKPSPAQSKIPLKQGLAIP